MNDYKFELAERYYQQGNYNASIDIFKELLAEDPNDALCHGLLAANLIGLSRIHAAEYEIKTALNLDPSHAFLHIIAAQICMMKNQLKLALESCDQALMLDVENVRALLVKSSIYTLLEKNNDAFNCIEQAAQIAPDSCDVITSFGDYYLETGDTKKAFSYASQALKVNAQDVDANLLMANVQLSLGNIDEAEYHTKFVILQKPDNRVALQLFANIKMRKNTLFGLWWKLNSKLATLSNLKATIILIGAYLFFNLAAQVAKDIGYPATATVISYSWLIFVIYTWVGIPYYQRKLASELKKFSFNPNY